MNWPRLRWKYWVDIFRRSQSEQDLDDEINAHIALETHERMSQGESRQAAHRAALRDIQSIALVKENTRDVWAWRTVEQVIQDLQTS